MSESFREPSAEPQPGVEIINPTQVLVAADMARLRALSRPDSGVVSIDYLLRSEMAGSTGHYYKNFATRNYGPAEYEAILRELMPAAIEMSYLDKLEGQE